ncbi:MAG: MBL fold metallo-hydrolase [Erythrobacter sp.]
MVSPSIHAFFDEDSKTFSYLVGDPETRDAAVIDPVLDFDLVSGTVSTRSVQAILDFAAAQDFRITMVLETHAHADHLSAAPFIKEKTGAWIGIGAHICATQEIFRDRFALRELQTDGSDFDRLFEDNDTFQLGNLSIQVMHVPGHTPADIAYVFDANAFIGDTLFMPDYGTARADFPGGDARALYRSIRRILSLPAETRLCLCHDYPGPNRAEPSWESSVAEQREGNIHLMAIANEEEFAAMRSERDKGLSPPKLLLPAIQVNIRAGRWPAPDENGISYLKLPLRVSDQKTTAAMTSLEAQT